MEFSESDEFKKEFKKLQKKYPSLEDDLKVVKKAIAANPAGNGTKHWNILKTDGAESHILKMRMMCRSVKGSQFRLIYFYDGQNVEVLFVEVYFKGSKEREDSERIDCLIVSLVEDKK
ncbi:hypothetical protein H6778_03825 [Candidatus Nomurabacteria bacterium]|nr:hypothetical protein [Candidatus Nomurabacteria bacterium]